MKKNVRCAVIGQHPLRFPWDFDEEDDGCRRMKLEMAQRIIKQSGVVLAVYAPTLRMGAPRIRLCPMRLHWADRSC